jgi:hypothetical protein
MEFQRRRKLHPCSRFARTMRILLLVRDLPGARKTGATAAKCDQPFQGLMSCSDYE